jgi:hypothetical protein
VGLSSAPTADLGDAGALSPIDYALRRAGGAVAPKGRSPAKDKQDTPVDAAVTLRKDGRAAINWSPGSLSTKGS